MNPKILTTWRIQSIDFKENMVLLESDQSPTIKRFGLPEPVVSVFVESDFLQVLCASGTSWFIRISDGSRRKIDKSLDQSCHPSPN